MWFKDEDIHGKDQLTCFESFLLKICGFWVGLGCLWVGFFWFWVFFVVVKKLLDKN